MSSEEEQIKLNNNSTLMNKPRLLSQWLTRRNLSTSKTPEDHPTSKSGKLILDGSNYSDSKEISSCPKKERYLTYLEAMIKRIKMYWYGPSMVERTKDGRWFMLINLNQSQLKDKSIQTSICTLRENSTLSHICQAEEELIS